MELKLETPGQEASRLGQKLIKEVDPINQPGTALLQAIKDPTSDPTNVANLQKAADDKYAVNALVKRYTDKPIDKITNEPKNLNDEPSKKEGPDSIISEIKAQPTQQEDDMTKYIERKNEVKGEAASLDKKAESFNKISKFGFGLGGVSSLTALGTWIGAASLPFLAPVAAPVIVGAGVVGGTSLAIAGISRFLKSRAQNKKDNLVNDNRAMFQYN